MVAAKSFRLQQELADRLSRAAKSLGVSQTELVGSLLDEGLKCRTFPGIVYRGGPTGRRAALSVGPDVWEVIATIRHVEGEGERKISNAAKMLALNERWVRLAVEFYTAFPEEVDERIALNEAAAEEVHARVRRRNRLLA